MASPRGAGSAHRGMQPQHRRRPRDPSHAKGSRSRPCRESRPRLQPDTGSHAAAAGSDTRANTNVGVGPAFRAGDRPARRQIRGPLLAAAVRACKHESQESSHVKGDQSCRCFAAIAATRWAGAGRLLLARSGHRRRPIGAIAFGIQTVGAARSLSHGRERQRRPTLTIASTIHATSAGRSPEGIALVGSPRLVGAARAPCRALASRATHKRADGAKSLPDADGAYARGARPQSVTAVPLLAISETLARRRSRPAFAFARVSRADANAWLPMSPSAVACDACADVASVIASSDERARRGPSRSWLLSRERQADCPALVGVSEVGEPRRMRAAVSRPPGRVRSVSRDGAAGGAEA